MALLLSCIISIISAVIATIITNNMHAKNLIKVQEVKEKHENSRLRLEFANKRRIKEEQAIKHSICLLEKISYAGSTTSNRIKMINQFDMKQINCEYEKITEWSIEIYANLSFMDFVHDDLIRMMGDCNMVWGYQHAFFYNYEKNSNEPVPVKLIESFKTLGTTCRIIENKLLDHLKKNRSESALG